jgi:hypothetical protein
MDAAVWIPPALMITATVVQVGVGALIHRVLKDQQRDYAISGKPSLATEIARLEALVAGVDTETTNELLELGKEIKAIRRVMDEGNALSSRKAGEVLSQISALQTLYAKLQVALDADQKTRDKDAERVDQSIRDIWSALPKRHSGHGGS